MAQEPIASAKHGITSGAGCFMYYMALRAALPHSHIQVLNDLQLLAEHPNTSRLTPPPSTPTDMPQVNFVYSMEAY